MEEQTEQAAPAESVESPGPDVKAVEEEIPPSSPEQIDSGQAGYLGKTFVQPKPVTEAQTHQGTEC